MTTLLFFQKFEGGAPATMPYDSVIECLSRYGKVGRGRWDTEVVFGGEDIAHRATVIGDAQQGTVCIALERPDFGDRMRLMAFELMERLGCCLFDDALETAYVIGGTGKEIAPPFGACVGAASRIASPQQLYPTGLVGGPASTQSPALLYTNPNPDGPHFQMFDSGDLDKNELTLEFRTHPAACNRGTLRVLRNIEQRVDAALVTNPEFHVFYRFEHHEAALLMMEFPKLAQLKKPITIDTNPFDAKEPGPAFRADGDLYEGVVGIARNLAGVRGPMLDGGAGTIDGFERLLQEEHGSYLERRRERPAPEDFFDRATMTAAKMYGSYLGEVIRREVGAQWGYIRLAEHMYPALRTHTGRDCYPMIVALDRIVNGAGESVADYFRELAATSKSSTAGGGDIAANVPTLCMILQGRAAFTNGGLPFPDQIPAAALDYSLASLKALDGYLAKVHVRVASLAGETLNNLLLSAGCYLGEVIRRNAAGKWQWANYDDYFRGREAQAQVRKQMGSSAILGGPDKAILPIGQIATLMMDGLRGGGTYEFAREWVGQAQPAPATQAAAPPQPAALEPATPRSINLWPLDAPMARALHALRAHAVKCRQRATKEDLRALWAAGPDWIVNDPLREILDKQALLLQHGIVGWGALVQANNLLMEPGPNDHPALMVRSTDEHFDGRPHALRCIARTLFALKDTTPATPPLRRIAAMITDERERVFDWPVPDILTSRKVTISAFMVFRRHLPEGVLRGAWFPILTHHDLRAAMILPHAWWTEDFLRLWREGALAG